MTDQIAPTQADRILVANILDEVSDLLDHNGIGQVADLIRDGEYDEHDCVKIAARHRIAAERTASAEPVAYLYGRDDGSCDLILDCNGEYARSLLESGATETPLYAAPPSADVGELVDRKYRMGDRVTKTKGSSWTGLVVGFYSTSLTPIGYAVESENEPGSVQIYPESALAKHGGAA